MRKLQQIRQRLIFGIAWTQKNGIVNLILWFANKRIRRITPSFDNGSYGTSISDGDSFNSFCHSAAKYDEVFMNFRRYQNIIDILDHVGIDHAWEYLRILEERQYPATEIVQRANQLDSFGNPRRFKFGKFGLLSPTATRYIKVDSDIKELFGPLTGRTVSEIGVGFGGQAFILCQSLRPTQYRMFDLPATLDLARRYLSKLESEAIVEFFDGRNPTKVDSDLVISNYAFSELVRDLQDKYLINVIDRSRCGYITWNLLSEHNLDGYTLDEILKRIPGSFAFPEEPLTAEGNVIIAWRRGD